MPITKKSKANKLRKEKYQRHSEITDDKDKFPHITGGMLKEILAVSRKSIDGAIPLTIFCDYCRVSRRTMYNRMDKPLQYLKPHEQEAVFQVFNNEEINNGIKAYNVKYGIKPNNL